MQKLVLSLLAVLGLISFSSCSSGVDFPEGSSKGYDSARLIKVKPSANITADEAVVHRMIQSSIRGQFVSRGLEYGKPDADLIVAYLVVYQDNAMTTYWDAYFGSGNDTEAISDAAHRKGVIEGSRPESFERAGLVVGVFDAKTNELIYRNYSAGDIIRGASQTQRASRINTAVNYALKPFFE